MIRCFIIFHNGNICSGFRRMRLYPDIGACASKWGALISEVIGYIFYVILIPLKVLWLIIYNSEVNICHRLCMKWDAKWHSSISVLIIIECLILFHNCKICWGYRRMRIYPDIGACASKWGAPISEVIGYFVRKRHRWRHRYMPI